MPLGFYLIMAAQFFSSLADNALLVAAISLLMQMQTPEWMTPLLKFFFTVSYVLFAAFVGAFADSMAKGKVMFLTNLVKIVGCLIIFFHEWFAVPGVPGYLVVLIAYSIVGLGAAAYSPAKYGILTELLPHQRLVIANGWIEGLTVASIILGTLLGGVLVSKAVSSILLEFDVPGINTGIDTPPEAAIAVIVVFYAIAAVFNLYIPDTGVDHRAPSRNPFYLVREFAHCVKLLWRDKLGQISLATTTLFWGAGATLQFIVLKWAEVALGYSLSQATVLQGVCAVGIALGAVIAARFVPLQRAVDVVPVGIAMGLIVIAMNLATTVSVAIPLMILIGALAGFFVVPMNALLQHRGHILMGAGHSIAVQNFNENLSILVMLSVYALLMWLNFSIYAVVVIFGLFVSSTMLLVRRAHLHNLRKGTIPVIPTEAH
ncbi:MAG: major facilitator superfamily 1 [Betaproteobacteria bacterium]|jgi:LPLT family lysophospholipid transporter-like MFS transporter|nr:major facilitator superfamily 1 [Betaproteobacteria bacterium]MEA3152444.1 transporter, family, lysophospholipid transporter [Betaproteobacteria bacterium]